MKSRLLTRMLVMGCSATVVATASAQMPPDLSAAYWQNAEQIAHLDPNLIHQKIKISDGKAEIINRGKHGILIIGDNNQITIIDGNAKEPQAGAQKSAAQNTRATAASKATSSSSEVGYIPVTSASPSALANAISQAKSDGVDSIIDLQPINGKTISLSGNLLSSALSGVDDHIWIVGDPSKRPVISGNGNYQILSVNDTTSSGTLSLFGFKMAQGKAEGSDGTGGGGGGLGAGGALFVNQGQVIVERMQFNNNKAQGGDSTGNAPGGSRGDQGTDGVDASGKGGKFNHDSSFSPFSAGSGGSGGSSQNDPKPGRNGNRGGFGSWGSGGGPGGGGAGSTTSSGGDGGGCGGPGGTGGWGAGGGAGAGGGGDDDGGNSGEVGQGGAGGYGGPSDHYWSDDNYDIKQAARNGTKSCYSGDTVGVTRLGGGGDDGNTASGSTGGQGSNGGGGAGLGGAIFVRDKGPYSDPFGNKGYDANSGPGGAEKIAAQVAIIHSSFSGNSTASGDGNSYGKDGKNDGKNFFYESHYNSANNAINLPPGADSDSSNVNYGPQNHDPNDWPEIELSLVDINGDDIDHVFEGERAYLKVTKQNGSWDESLDIYVYINPNKTDASRGTNPDVATQNTGDDFAWPEKIYQKINPPNSNDHFYISFPEISGGATNAIGEETGIVTYIDKEIEGDEQFTVDLLSGEGYRLGDNYSQTVIIKDTNYQAKLLTDSANARLDISDAADALEATGSNAFDPTQEINVADLKALGYVTVQLERADGVLNTQGSIPDSYSHIDTKVYDQFFNGALAAGMQVHYSITNTADHGVEYFSNRYNYNITGRYTGGVDGGDVYNAVVVPPAYAETEEETGLLPGQARIYFSALPDAVQKDPGSYTLSLKTFTDKSCDPGAAEQLCGINTPDEDYRFYKVSPNGDDQATFTISDSGEFIDGVIIADTVNGAPISSDNPLVADADGNLKLRLKLASDPNGSVTIAVQGKNYSFDSSNWYLYQEADYTGLNAGDTFSVGSYGTAGDEDLTLAAAHSQAKIHEGSIPDVGQRSVSLKLVPAKAEVGEGGIQPAEFILSLGQALAYDISLQYAFDGADACASESVTIPAYRQIARVRHPAMENDDEDGDRSVSMTLCDTALPSGIELVGGNSASVTILDNDTANIIVTQQLPNAPLPGDISYFVPEIEVLGIDANGIPVIQSRDPRVKDIVLARLDDNGLTTTEQTQARGLLQEKSKADGTADAPQILFPEHADEAELLSSGFDIQGLENQKYYRFRALLRLPEGSSTTEYQLSTQTSNADVELWFNPAGPDSQNKGLAIKPGQVDSATYTLEPGISYFIEALVETTGSGAGLQILADGNVIPQEQLTPWPLENGFVMETWEGDDVVSQSIDGFINSDAYQRAADSTKMLTNELHVPKTTLYEPADTARRISTVLIAPETGYYRFAVASDGDSQLTLSGNGLSDEPIAWVDGDERYGEVIYDSRSHTSLSDVSMTIRRNVSKDNWQLEYSAPTTKTLPFGANRTVSLYNSSWTEQVCDNYKFVDSPNVGNIASNAVETNTLTLQGIPTSEVNTCNNPTLGIYPNYDGTEITFYFQDYADSSVEYENFILDGHDLSLPPAYPADQQWNWAPTGELCSEEPKPEGCSKPQSEPVYLKQGQSYRLQVLQVNSRDDDHLSVAWQRPSADHLEQLNAEHLSLPQVNLPLELAANPQECTPVQDDKACARLRLKLNRLTLFEQDYRVTSITLSGANSADDLDAATLNFASGFIGSLDQDVTVAPNLYRNPTAQFTPLNIVSDLSQLSLTVGKQALLGVQLDTPPGGDLDVSLSAINNSPQLLSFSPATLSFNDSNWQQAQQVTVTATQASLDNAGVYQPEQSKVTISATADNYNSDGIDITTFPFQYSNDALYIAKTHNQDIDTLAFNPDTGAIAVYFLFDGIDMQQTNWVWELDGEDLIAKLDGGEVLRLTSGSDALTLPISAGSDALPLFADVKVHKNFINSAKSQNAAYRIDGIRLQTNGTDSAAVTVTVDNAQPSIQLSAALSGNLTATAKPKKINYTPNYSGAQTISANADETLITEYGVITLYEAQSSYAWRYEPNARSQPATLSFSVHSDEGDETVNVDLATYNSTPQLATSLLALPDANTAKVAISADSVQHAEGDSVTLSFQRDGDTSNPLTVFYQAVNKGSDDPGNTALNLLPDADTLSLELGAEDVELQVDGDKQFTVEMWIRPNAMSGKQGLFTGTKDGSPADILWLNGQELKGPNNLAYAFPNDVSGQWTHIAYTSKSSNHTLYLNGQKVATADIAPNQANYLTAIGRSKDDDYFSGMIDEVRVWDMPPSDTEIFNNYATAVAIHEDGMEKDLSAYWDFNEGHIQNRMREDDVVTLQDSNNTTIALNTDNLWFQRSAATQAEDYGLSAAVKVDQANLFNLQADKLGGMSRFAVADFNGDGRKDAIVLDGKGTLRLFLRHKNTSGFLDRVLHNGLSRSSVLSAGDIDGDGKADLLLGDGAGKLRWLKNRSKRQQLRFSALKALKLPGKNRNRKPLSPTLADLNGDGRDELITIDADGRVQYFELRGKRAKASKKTLLPKLPNSDQGYFLQFADLDGDGDLDAVADYLRIKPGQRPGALRYFKNYGNAESPYFVAAPRDRVAYRLRKLDSQRFYGKRLVTQQYDQVGFHQYTDWNGDGRLDVLQSDSRGVINALSVAETPSVTIPAGETQVTADISLTDDDYAEGLEYLQVRLVEGNMATSGYHADPTADRVAIEITPNDVPGLKVAANGGSELDNLEVITLDEGGSSKAYDIQLQSKPTADVSIRVVSSDPVHGLAAFRADGGTPVASDYQEQQTLIISPDNWNQAHTVYLKAVDEQIADEGAQVYFGIVSHSQDNNYLDHQFALVGNTVNNGDEAGVLVTLDSLPQAQTSPNVTEGEINTLKVRLSSRPTQPIVLRMQPTDKQLTFYPQRRIVSQVSMKGVAKQVSHVRAQSRDADSCTESQGNYGTLCWYEDGRYSYTQTTETDRIGIREHFAFVVDNGYAQNSTETLSIRLPGPLLQGQRIAYSRSGSLLEKQGNILSDTLAGDGMELRFTPDTWDVPRSVAVAAVDDSMVEYHHLADIQLLLKDVNQTVPGRIGNMGWQENGSLSYIIPSANNLSAGVHQEQRFYFTRSDDAWRNHTLDLQVTVNDAGSYQVFGVVDAGRLSETQISFTEDSSLNFSADLGFALSMLATTPQDAAYMAAELEPLQVSIQDNDLPIVRAGVDLQADEPSHPGYFTFSVSEPVNDPAGLPVHYSLYAEYDGDPRVTTELGDPATGELQDPGPDLQITEALKQGTLFIPHGKTRVSFPIFPVDDSTPEESLAMRYEQVIVKLQEEPNGLYLLDKYSPSSQEAAVRIMDDEKVGLRIVMPADGLVVEEGKFNSFKVGLKSQPQTEVTLDFFHDHIIAGQAFDGSFVQADSVNFDNTDWNQWKKVEVRAFDNLVSNEDSRQPRYGDLYFSLTDKGCGSNVKDCEPFYNTEKGALNLIDPTAEHPDAKEAEAVDTLITRIDGHNASTSTISTDWGKLTLTEAAGALKGDFTYRLDDSKRDDLLDDILASSTGFITDVIPYEMDGYSDQQLVVQIKAMNQVGLEDPGSTISGRFGSLKIASDGSYEYGIDTGELPSGDSWIARDYFTYTLTTPGINGGDDIETYYSFIIALIQEDGADLRAYVEGAEPEDCNSGSDGLQTVCSDTVKGNVLHSDVGSPYTTATAPTLTISAFGKSRLRPKVTSMYLQDKSGNDLLVQGERVLTNPLYTTNHINTVADMVALSSSNSDISANNGVLTINENGDYSYQISLDLLSDGLAEGEERTVHDRFRYRLEDGTDTYLELVSVYDYDSASAVIYADGVAADISFASDQFTATGKLSPLDGSDQPLTIAQAGPAHPSVQLRDVLLSPVVVLEGLDSMIMAMQRGLYDSSVPVLGRLGGRGSGDVSGDNSDSHIPSFGDRLMATLEDQITKQPHLSPHQLSVVFTKAIEAAFGEVGLPVTVVTLDTEKIALRFNMTAGYEFVDAEFEGDIGMPALGSFSGEFRAGMRASMNAVFGIKFRTFAEDANGDNSWQPGFFIITDEEALNALTMEAIEEPADLYNVTVFDGYSMDPKGLSYEYLSDPKPVETITAADGVDIAWWHSEDLNSIDGMAIKGDTQVRFLSVSLLQPGGVRPGSSNAPLYVSAQADPDGWMTSAKAGSREEYTLVRTALEAVESQQLTFKDKMIYTNTFGSEPQGHGLKATLIVNVAKQTDNVPFSIPRDTYTAKVSTSAQAPEYDIADKLNLTGDWKLMRAGQSYDMSRESGGSVTIACESTQNYRCKPKNQLSVKVDGANEKLYPPSRELKTVFEGKTKVTYRVPSDKGEVKITGNFSGSNVVWDWTFSAEQSYPKDADWTKDGYIKAKVTVAEDKSSTNKSEMDFAIGRWPVAFLQGDKVADPLIDFVPVTKISGEVWGDLDFRGALHLALMGGSIEQAVATPTNPPSNSSGDPQVEPARAYQDLIGKLSSRDQRMDITEGSSGFDWDGDAVSMVGKYGILFVGADNKFTYTLRPEFIVDDDPQFHCDGSEALPYQGVYEELCGYILDEDSEYWNVSANEHFNVRGYEISCDADGGLDAAATCTLWDRFVLKTDKTADELQKTGVPTLESAFDLADEGIPGWGSTASLTNRTAVGYLSELKDTFYIATVGDPEFSEVEITVTGNTLAIHYKDGSKDGLLPSQNSGISTGTTWQDTIPSVVQSFSEASPGQIQPMARARVFIEAALKSPERENCSDCDMEGLTWLFGDEPAKQRSHLLFTMGGDAAMFSQFSVGPDFPGLSDDSAELPLPALTGKLGLISRWAALSDRADVAGAGGEFIFGVYDLGVDLGSFISDQLVEPLSHVSNIFEPIRPVATALTTDLKVFSELNLEATFDANKDGGVTIMEVPSPFLKQGGSKARQYEQILKQINYWMTFAAQIFQMIEISADLGRQLEGAKALQEPAYTTDAQLVNPEDIRVAPIQSDSGLSGVPNTLIPYADQKGHIILGTTFGYEVVRTLGGPPVSAGTVKEVNSDKPKNDYANKKPNTNQSSVKKRMSSWQNSGIVSFPILENPLDILQLLFGDPAELFIINAPPLDVDFELFEKKFRIPGVPVFYGKIDGRFEILSDIQFGVDTAGLQQSICGSSSPYSAWDCNTDPDMTGQERAFRILNSIYMRDWSEESYLIDGDGLGNKDHWRGEVRQLPSKTVFDYYELAGNIEFKAGAGVDLVVIGSGFEGGPGFGGGIDLVDLCESTTPEACETPQGWSSNAEAYYDGKIRAYDFLTQISDDYTETFDLGLEFYVEFDAYIESFEQRVWESVIGRFTLFTIDNDGLHWAGAGRSADGNPIVGGMVFFDANGNRLPDADEPYAFTDRNGRAAMNIPFNKFDRNRDGRIDAQDGTLVLADGLDGKTGKPLYRPLMASPQQRVISPQSTRTLH